MSPPRSAQFAPRWNQAPAAGARTFQDQRQGATGIKRVVSDLINAESVTAFGLFFATLFIGQLGAKGALMIVGLTGAYGLLHIMRLYEILRPRAFILAIPLVAIFSTFWSETPQETLKYSLEFAITAGAALMLSASRRPTAVVFGLFAAFAIYISYSLAFGQSVQMGTTGATAFSGLNRSKNLLADIASTGLLVSAAMFLVAAAERRLFLVAGAALFSLVQLYVLIEARSAGAMLGFGLAASVFMFLLALRSVGPAVRAAAMSFLVLCLLSASLSYRFLSNALIDAGARFFDKDPTLTGRTYLWQRALDLINETPWLGRGFGSFWQQGNPDAEGLWQFAGIGSRNGFNFHNTAIEILVHLGWFGLIICTVVMIIAVGFLVARFLARPNLFHCFWLSVLTYEMVRMPIESVGLNEFYFSTLLLFMALGSAFAFPARKPDAVPQHRMRPIASARAIA